MSASAPDPIPQRDAGSPREVAPRDVSPRDVSPREVTSPYIVLTRPICTNCGATMRLVRIDLHPLYLDSEVCRYDCACGATQSNTADHRSVVAGAGIPPAGTGEDSAPLRS